MTDHTSPCSSFPSFCSVRSALSQCCRVSTVAVADVSNIGQRTGGAPLHFFPSPYEIVNDSGAPSGAPETPTVAVPAGELEAMGFSLVIYPIDTLLAATSAVLRTLEHLRVDGRTPDSLISIDFKRFNELMGLQGYVDISDKLAEATGQQA